MWTRLKRGYWVCPLLVAFPGLAISWWNTVDDRNILSSSIMTGFFWGYVDILLEKTKSRDGNGFLIQNHQSRTANLDQRSGGLGPRLPGNTSYGRGDTMLLGWSWVLTATPLTAQMSKAKVAAAKFGSIGQFSTMIFHENPSSLQ
jgi:hypothetical protein